MNKSLSFLIYALVWLVLVLVQSLLMSGSGANAAFWQSPQQYYSLWLVDVFLIILFYANYYIIAPKMIRRRLFYPYILLSLVFAIIGLFIPVVCYHAWHWTLPGYAPGTIPYSTLGAVGAIAVMAIGLSVRGVKEWINLEDEMKAGIITRDEMQQEIHKLQKENEELKPKPINETRVMTPPPATDTVIESQSDATPPEEVIP